MGFIQIEFNPYISLARFASYMSLLFYNVYKQYPGIQNYSSGFVFELMNKICI